METSHLTTVAEVIQLESILIEILSIGVAVMVSIHNPLTLHPIGPRFVT
jgi:hypothetical protein